MFFDSKLSPQHFSGNGGGVDWQFFHRPFASPTHGPKNAKGFLLEFCAWWIL